MAEIPVGIRIHKLESFKRLINLVLVGIGLGIEVAWFAHFWFRTFRGSVVVQLQFFTKGNAMQISFYAILLVMASMMYGGMRLGYLRNAEILFSQMFATLAVNVLQYIQLCLMARKLLPLGDFAAMSLAQGLCILLWISLANKLYRSVFPPRKLFLIHGSRPVEDICAKLEGRRDKYRLAGRMSEEELDMPGWEQRLLEDYSRGHYTALVVWDTRMDSRNRLIKFGYAHSIRVYVMPKITDVILRGAEELHLFDSPLLLTREYRLSMEQRFFKRAIDIGCSVILLILSLPIMLLTAIAVKLYDGGPVLYKQIRCTKDQRQFAIMKFRSMRTDAEKDGVARLAQKEDARITPIGRFIRKVRIDELPQLLNILKGDMSFIGPRPERPEIICQYVEIMPEFAFRMKVKAGLAGYAQVYGKYNTSPYDKLKLDLTYIENYSLWLDFKLMLLTLKVLFWPDSTEGVESQQVTAFKEEYQKKKQEKTSREDEPI